MKISENLNRIIMAAYAEANVRRHEFITPEHLLYACLFFDEGKEIILHCGGDPAHLKQVIEKHLDESDMAMSKTPRAVQSLGFQSVLERAAWHTSSAQKEVLELGDILVALLDEKESHASYFLHREGISRLGLLNFISHGMSVLPGEEGELRTSPETQEGDAGRDEREQKQNKFLRAYT
ncbi:MAG: ATP-dependent Clp protease ATP-binding subunit ClpA, partial [Deltaproteobacteria bacterium]|nr:ATP-dependent Clp protease ATP-binding subunit ClpA [Deltaproteobacteria bacterium]